MPGTNFSPERGFKMGSGTTVGTWVKTIATAIEDCGCDPEALFSKADIPLDKSIGTEARTPDQQLRRVYSICADACDTPYFGLHLGQHVHAHSFHALGFSFLSSNTVGDALKRICRYSAIVSNSAQARLVSAGNSHRFELLSFRDQQGEALIPTPPFEAVLSGFLNLLRGMSGVRGLPQRVLLTRDTPPDRKYFERHFDADVQFGAPFNGLVLSNKSLEQPLRSANETLARHQDSMIETCIATLTPHFDQRVRRHIIELLREDELSLPRLASRMHMSLRNLQHRLKSRSTSYQGLVDQVRYQEACSQLQHPECSVTEVAFALGFSSGAGFTRAFRRWSGGSPQDYRRKLARPDHSAAVTGFQ